MRVLLVAYDSEMHINYFPLGLAYVASKMRKQGYDVEVYHQDVYHYPESHLAEYLSREKFDVVGVGTCAGYYQYQKLLKIAEVIPQGVKLWLGGHMVSVCPDYFKEITKADYICEGEYDYEKELDNIPLPAWDLFPIDYYALIRLPHAVNSDRCFPVLSGRGCPFRCNFCYRMEEGYRARDISGIVEEISILSKDYRINYIDFADELLMAGVERTRKICEALKPLNIKWMCNGRLNYARLDVLGEMRKAGCVFINYGIESVDDEVLRNMNKQLTYEQIVKGVEATLEEGISPGLNIIWGNIGDTKETLWKAVNFLKKYGDGSQMRTIRPVTPYPGCDLFNYVVEKGLIKDCADFYENKHKNSDFPTVNLTDMDDFGMRYELNKANRELIDDYLIKTGFFLRRQSDRIYLNKDFSFRGFRQT